MVLGAQVAQGLSSTALGRGIVVVWIIRVASGIRRLVSRRGRGLCLRRLGTCTVLLRRGLVRVRGIIILVVLLVVLAADRIVTGAVVRIVRGHNDATSTKRYTRSIEKPQTRPPKTVEMTRRRMLGDEAWYHEISSFIRPEEDSWSYQYVQTTTRAFATRC